METARLARAAQTAANAWARLGEKAGNAGSDYLIPWQTCELASAPVRDWRKLPAARRRLTGWQESLPLDPQTRLTLAVQAAPAWNPAAPPPGLSAANADLFPPCYFTLAVGSGGCRMAAEFWHRVCREHGVDGETGVPRDEAAPTGSWRGFFRNRGGCCEPHAVFAGLDETETGALAELFPRPGILSGEAGAALAEEILLFMQEHSEDAGSPAGILMFASLEGGTASALSSEVLERLRAQFPAMPILVTGVLPLAGVSPVVTAPWHLALALQAIRRHATAGLLFSNDLLISQAARDWHLPAPGYAEANLLIAECLAALTAPLRFGGSDSQPVDLRSLLECFAPGPAGQPPMITARCWPLSALTDRRLRDITLPWLTERTLRAAAAAHLTRAEAVAAFLRVRLAPPENPWIQDESPLPASITGRTETGSHESAAVFAESPAIHRILARLQKQARELLRLDSAPALCAQLRVSLAELQEAVQGMAAPGD